MVTSFNMLILIQHDLDKAVAFYEQLGFLKRFHLAHKWAEMDLKGFRLGLCPSSMSQSQGSMHTGMVLEVEDIDVMHARCKELSIASGPVIEKMHGKMMTIYDPANNGIDLYEPSSVARGKKEAKECGKVVCCQRK